jgi:DNA primase
VLSLLTAARPLSEHLFHSVLPRGAASSFEEKMQALDRLKPTLTQLPVGLWRSAFFAGLARHMGLPAAELEAASRGKSAAPRPAPKPSRLDDDSPRRVEKGPDALEAAVVASVLLDPELAKGEGSHLADEISHPGLRGVVAQRVTGASREDALYDASEQVRAALETAIRTLPPAGPTLGEAFVAVSKRLRLRRIDEQLSHIARAAQRVADPEGLGEEIRRLQQERIELLSLRKRVQEAAGPVSGGLGRTNL